MFSSLYYKAYSSNADKKKSDATTKSDDISKPAGKEVEPLLGPMGGKEGEAEAGFVSKAEEGAGKV